MQFIILALAGLAAAGAIPGLKQRAPSDLCPALDTPLCCQLDVDGVVASTCEAPEGDPATTADFEAACASIGSKNYCCTLPLAGDALLCS